MFTIYILIILLNFGVLTSSEDRHNRAAKVQCKESIDTVEEVRTCPKDKEAWDERARVKECGNVPHNCSDTPLSYHCVLDEFGHGLVEVCAVWTEIIGGECAEFTPGGMFIQEHYENSCRSCPFAYNSSMGYLYGECYDFAVFGITTDGLSTQQQTETGVTEMTVSAANNSSQPQESIAVWYMTLLAVLGGIVAPVASVGSLLYLFYRSEKRGKKKKTQYLHEEDVSITLLNKDNDGDETKKTSDCISSGKPSVHCTEEVEHINDGRLRVLPSGRTLNSDAPEKKAMPSSSEEMPVISLNEELNEKQAQECRVLLEDLNEEIDDTIKQSEHCEVTDETLHEHLVQIFKHSYIFPETFEGLKKLKECMQLLKELKSYMNRKRQTQIEFSPPE